MILILYLCRPKLKISKRNHTIGANNRYICIREKVKTNAMTTHHNTTYITPEIEILSTRVEEGFAASFGVEIEDVEGSKEEEDW